MTRQSWRVILAVVLTVMLTSRTSAAQQLAFTSYRSGTFQIYLMNADGSGLTNLSNTARSDQTPSWSPDGRRIVFSSKRQGNWDLYVFDVTSGTTAGATRLTTDPNVDICPSWSPDGQIIAFTSNRTGRYAIYVMDVNGGEPTQVTGGAADDISPAYSPDGTEIAFISNEARLGYDPFVGSGIITMETDIVHFDYGGLFLSVGDVCVTRADGTNRRNLTGATDQIQNNHLSWFPDGTSILVHAIRSAPAPAFVKDYGIYQLTTHGTFISHLLRPDTGPAFNALWPTYSPDGRRIALTGTRGYLGQGRSIWVMNADGSGATQITEDASGYEDSSPVWRPVSGDGSVVEISTWGSVKSIGRRP